MSTYIWESSTVFERGENTPIVLIFGRDVDTNEVKRFATQNFKPYFFERDNNGKLLSCYGEKIKKTMFDNIRELREHRSMCKINKVNTYEADVDLDYRYLIDKKISYGFNEKMEPVEVPMKLPRICYFDIEVNIPTGEGIDEEKSKHPIVAIGVMDSFTEEIKIFTFGFGKVSDIQTDFPTEKELLVAFADYVHDLDPDILTGWCSKDFDMPYILNRAKLRFADISGLSRLRKIYPSEYKIAGRSHADSYELFKDWSKPMGQQPSYGLKYIAKTFCDFVYEEQGAHIAELIEQKRFSDIVTYLTNDVRALRKIDLRFGLFKYHEFLRKLIGVKMDDIIKRTALIETLLMRKGIKPIPTKKTFQKEDIVGAYVHQPTPGLKYWVACLDLKSLYPSIILALNISPDIDNMIPKTITFVLNEREKLRAQRMSGTADDTVETSEQSLKYVANAFYGYLGSIYAKLYYPEGARLITETGRDIAKELREHLVSKGYNIEYGDSVDGKTIIEVDGNYVPIESLYTTTDYKDGDKEYCILSRSTTTINDSLQSVVEPIRYIMRHKCNKQMYRLWFGNSNYLDVTEDHSLIVYNRGVLEERKPQSLKSKLIWKTKTFYHVDSRNYPKELYEFMGFFVGDGSYNVKFNEKNYYLHLATGLDTDEIVNKIIEPLKAYGYITNYYIKKKGDICITGLKLCNIMNEFRNETGKIIPEFLYKETKENISSFIRGYFSADGTVSVRNNTSIIRLTSVNTDLIISTQRLLTRVGVSSNWFTETKPNYYKEKCSNTFSKHLVIKNREAFKREIGFVIDRKYNKIGNPIDKFTDITLVTPTKIEPISSPEFVYDIEVNSAHRFFANNILVHNTDSTFISPVTSVEMGKEIEGCINDYLKEWAVRHKVSANFAPTIKFEKLYDKILFKKKNNSDEAAKKNYAGHLVWKDGHDKDELSYTGLGIKRSDNAPISKWLMENFFQLVLIKGDVDGAVKIVSQAIKDVTTGDINIHKIAIPKAIKSERENAWVKGRNAGEKYLGIRFQKSSKPKILYCRSPVKEICIDDDAVSDEIKKKISIDWVLMCDKTVTQKMKSLIESLGVNWNNVILGQQTWDDFR